MYRLIGLLDDSYGYPVIRGFAPISDLIKYSESPDFQRDLDNGHVEDIKNYLNSSETRFIPELIFSLKINWASENALADLDIYNKISSEKNDLIITRYKRKTSEPFIRVRIDFDVNIKPLIRIDGNHRLEAFSQLNDVIGVDKKKYAFSIIIDNNISRDKRVKEIFHTVNSTAKPLKQEQLIKAVIDDDLGFPDDMLKENHSFGIEYYYTRKLLSSGIDLLLLPNIKNLIDKDKRELWVSIFKLLNEEKALNDSEDYIENIKKALSNINSIYEEPCLKNSSNKSLIGLFLLYELQKSYKKNILKKWVLNNHIYELNSIDMKPLLKIFTKIAESKKKTIFVSMQFCEQTKQNYLAIEQAINDVNNECNQEISIKLIRIDQFCNGNSYTITGEILKHIEEAGYMIADLTFGNKNVYHEIGYLMGINYTKGDLDNNFLLIHNSSVNPIENDIGFNISAIKQIRVNDTNDLRNRIKKEIKKYYELS